MKAGKKIDDKDAFEDIVDAEERLGNRDPIPQHRDKTEKEEENNEPVPGKSGEFIRGGSEEKKREDDDER